MLKNYLSFILTFSGLLLLWQTSIMIFNIPHYILPTPSAVIGAFQKNFTLIISHSGITVIETFLALALGISAGSLLGLALAFSVRIKKLLLPLLIISQALPTFAIAPLIVIWAGFGLASKIIIAWLMIFFPICSAFYDGLRNTPSAWIQFSQVQQASRYRTFRHIIIPAALPAWASGIRLAAVTAPLGAIVGEWVGSSQGLGYLMMNANARMQIALMFAVTMMIIVLSLSLYKIIDKILKKLIWWQPA